MVNMCHSATDVVFIRFPLSFLFCSQYFCPSLHSFRLTALLQQITPLKPDKSNQFGQITRQLTRALKDTCEHELSSSTLSSVCRRRAAGVSE